MRYQQNLLEAYRSRGLLNQDTGAATTDNAAATTDSATAAATSASEAVSAPPDGFSTDKIADRPSRPPIVMPLDHFHGPSFHALLNDYRAENARSELAGNGEEEGIGAEAEVEGGSGAGVGAGVGAGTGAESGVAGSSGEGGAKSPPLTLPIDAHREEILEHVRNNRVTVIHGETGSGKSSRLPVMLVEEAMARGGRRAKMFVSQPRRAATRALAQRVREEAEESGGKWSVAMRLGHGVREGPRGAEVTFATTGYIVRLIANSPGLLDSHTHLIIDEVGVAGISAAPVAVAMAAVIAVAAMEGRVMLSCLRVCSCAFCSFIFLFC